MLSNLLWAAFGVNRDQASFDKPGRTAPSASNSQEIDLYVALLDGVYLYEAIPHRLSPVAAGDFRRRSGRGRAATAPLNIFYVAELARYDLGPDQPDRAIGDPEVQKSYYYTDTGFIAQNVYLLLPHKDLQPGFTTVTKRTQSVNSSLCPRSEYSSHKPWVTPSEVYKPALKLVNHL